MAELDYRGIKEMLDGDLFGVGVDEEGNHVILQAERIEGETVYTAMWETKRNERVTWYVKHWYHEDGTVEETFEHEEIL